MQQGIGSEPGNGIGIAVFLAAALHAILVLGIGFSAGDTPEYTPQLEITLAQRPTSLTQENARHLAQFNQQGSGNNDEQTSVTDSASAPLLVGTAETPDTAPAAVPRRQAEAPLVSENSTRQTLPQQRAGTTTTPMGAAGTNPEADQFDRELARLQAALEDQARDYSELPRVRRLTSLSTRSAIDAAYLHDWRKRVEAVGNRYYPEASVRYGIYGSLRLLVVINYDGRLEDIQVLSSSGFAVLDEAAMKIVRMAEPYAPFPAELRATTDKLEIIRTWQFEENTLSSERG
ncbi:energy transducer TonB [Kineobactrum sediminis]|uniref:Energy transducer TonB n=1 Tax=Kineobactrum sediminis TaxID=1905677 RepID=A0A2N5Y539_9GAMM|nr:energy transducer TonB [Kineobactrum sediminis]PLW83520.1 energy transducer TonB [Kineobactrum sediminis]